MQVVVRDNNVDQALRALKKKMQREGIFREMKLRNYYEKPSRSAPARRPKPSVAPASSPARRLSAKASFRPSRDAPRPGALAHSPSDTEQYGRATPAIRVCSFPLKVDESVTAARRGRA